MTSILKVSEIQDPTNGNTALTVDTSGRILTPARPVFTASRFSNQNAGIIIFDSALVNQGSHYNTSDGKFVAPIAGLYSFSFHALSDNDGVDSYYSISLYINGSSYAVEQSYTYEDNDSSAGGSIVASLSVNDYVQVHSSKNVYGYGTGEFNCTYFSGFLLG